MGHRTAAEGHRVLVSAPYGRDAESLAELLRAERYDVAICPDLDAVAAATDEHVGVILLTDEALKNDLRRLKSALNAQPPWSDIPFVLLTARRATQTATNKLPLPHLDFVTNSIVLERPLGRASLISAVASAMRSRQKQFEMRDRMAELAKSESRLRLAIDAADIGTWDYDPITDHLNWDARCKALFGLGRHAQITLEGTFYRGIHPDDLEATREAVTAALNPGGTGTYDIEFRTIGLEDGVERWVTAKGGSVFENGRTVRFIGTIIDITARKTAELGLDQLARTLEEQVTSRTAQLEDEIARRDSVEAALRQAQKMEAVGQLTGGIAHDFNNMLTGVIGGLDIIRRRIETGRLDDLSRFMDAASNSAQRAAALTARLLAFSRRQSLDAKPLDVNELMFSIEELLRRTVRENISLRIVPGENLPNVVADANQLENALLNLTINARDAMPEGGLLTVETSFVELDEAYVAMKPGVKAGRYVVIAVTDTGVGMPTNILEKVFEPFYTTKPIGQGTGLGLSMVYGFARQSGGQVRIHSRPGEGTSVKIYFPATEATATVAAPPASAPLRNGDGQTVLVVEDDPAVRLLVREVLTELRYQVEEADEATSALKILSSDRAIELMISDVGLPGMNGRQLAELARTHRPDLPVLFVTGYAENAAIRAGFLGTNMAMITKPFTLEALASKIDEMIS